MATRWRRSSRRGLLLAAGIFLGQLVLYGPSLVGQKVLLPLDILTLPGAYLPRASVVPPATPHNYVLADLVCLGEPGRRFLADEFRAGRYAGWNPYQFAAPPTAPRFSPFTVLLCSLRSPVIIAWAQLLVAEIAGIGFYLFCRRTMEIGFWPAAIAGWCYPLTGYFILWQGYGIPYTVCWLPWLLMAVDAVVRGGTRWALAAMMLFTALAVVSGQTDVAGQVLLTSGLFAVGRLAELNWLNVVRRSASQFTTRSVVPHQELRRREHGTVPFGRKGTTFWALARGPARRSNGPKNEPIPGGLCRARCPQRVGPCRGLERRTSVGRTASCAASGVYADRGPYGSPQQRGGRTAADRPGSPAASRHSAHLRLDREGLLRRLSARAG